MKKLLSVSILSLSMLIGVSVAEAKTSSAAELNSPASATPAVQVRRTVVRTRTVRRGRALYRETYRTTYYRNGRTVTRLARRVRVR